jgi:hypothetical protein
MLSLSTATRNAALNGTGIKEQFDGGFLYLFAGTVPSSANDALNMTTTHTEMVVISLDGLGVDGLTFDAPSAGVLAKAAAEAWRGVAAFDGAEDSETSLTATFYRLCADGDDGRGAANASTGYRIQGVIDEPGSGADLELANPVIASGYLQVIDTFTYTLQGG